MNKYTKLWQEVMTNIDDLKDDDLFTSAVYQNFSEIFDFKEVKEYKVAAVSDTLAPSQFQHIAAAMKRAFVEGYLTAQLEQKKEKIKMLYKCYNSDIKEDRNEKSRNCSSYTSLANTFSRKHSDNA